MVKSLGLIQMIFLKIILLNQQKKENETQSQLISEQIKNEYYEYCVKHKKTQLLIS